MNTFKQSQRRAISKEIEREKMKDEISLPLIFVVVEEEFYRQIP